MPGLGSSSGAGKQQQQSAQFGQQPGQQDANKSVLNTSLGGGGPGSVSGGTGGGAGGVGTMGGVAARPLSVKDQPIPPAMMETVENFKLAYLVIQSIYFAWFYFKAIFMYDNEYVNPGSRWKR